MARRARAGNPLFTYRPDVEEALLFTGQARDMVQDVGQAIAAQAARDAPKQTGAGAESIRSEPRLGPSGWEARVSWTRRRFYLYFSERGTIHMPARPFLRPALDKARSKF